MKAMHHLPPETLEHVADYFRALSEPTRLRILNALGTGELSVGDIALRVDSSVANVSRHLAQMAQHGLVARESRGSSAYYRIADPAVHQLCDLVCGSLLRRFDDMASARAALAESGKPTQNA
jgi:DNA-binding transcriptional ArsR family regulator